MEEAAAAASDAAASVASTVRETMETVAVGDAIYRRQAGLPNQPAKERKKEADKAAERAATEAAAKATAEIGVPELGGGNVCRACGGPRFGRKVCAACGAHASTWRTSQGAAGSSTVTGGGHCKDG